MQLTWQAFVLSAASVVQVAAFTFIYAGTVEIYETFFSQLKPVFGFGMQLEVSVYVLGVLAAINALVVTTVQRFEIKWASAMASTALWALYWASISVVVPNRFLLIVVAGMMSFHIGILICDLMPTATDSTERSLR